MNITDFRHAITLIFEAGEQNERQEQAIIAAISKSVNQNNGPIKVLGIPDQIKYAVKKQNEPGYTKEPYTDIVLGGIKQIWNISCKDLSAPSLAGGGITGLKEIFSKTNKAFIQNVHTAIINAYKKIGLVAGKTYQPNEIPDIYIKIPENLNIAILRGVKSMGGPIDFMYIGSMDVKYTFDVNTQTCEFTNGKFVSIEKFAIENSLYIRARKRRKWLCKFTPTVNKANSNIPSILTGIKGNIQDPGILRIVITNHTPMNAVIIPWNSSN